MLPCMHKAPWGLVGLALLALACAGGSGGGAPKGDYLKHVAFPAGLNDWILLRWPENEIPLQIHLPRPPEGYFEDSQAVWESVRDGVLDWSDVAAPGVPSFEFVDDPGEADIPIFWIQKPNGAWFIAHCAYGMSQLDRKLKIAHIQVTARREDGSAADLSDVYGTMLHEMGHALGMGGHSPEPTDIMYPYIQPQLEPGLSERDRATLRKLYQRPIGARVVGARRER